MPPAFRFGRRNKVVLATVAAVAAVLVVGLAVSLWQAARARNAEQAAREKAALAVAERDTAVARRAADQERESADRQRADAERHLYVANMNLVLPAWEQNNFGRVRQLLEETATYPQRGFEWYYWQRQAHLELVTLRGHLGAVLAVAFSRDGQRMVTGSDDNTAKVWDAASGQ